MQKINFQNGSIIEPNFLNAVQHPPRFTAEVGRANYYSTTEEGLTWHINQRDSLKDWEISNEPETSVGKLAHHGRVLGWTTINSDDGLVVAYGPPKLTTYDFDGITELSGYNAIIEAGSVINDMFEVQSWERQLLPIEGNVVNYIYYDLSLNLLRAEAELPSRSEKFAPLARLEVDFSGNVVEYLDLRQSTYIDSLGFYTQKLNNTLYVNSNSVLVPWSRAIVDTLAGSIILTVPDEDNSKDGDEIALVDISFSFDSRPVILRSSASTSVHNTTEDWVIYNKGIYLELYYHAETRSWNFKTPPAQEETPKEIGTFLRCGGEIYLGIRPESLCMPDTEVPELDGTFRYNADTSQCYKRIHTDFATYSDGNSGVYTEKAIRCGATRLEVKNWINS